MEREEILSYLSHIKQNLQKEGIEKIGLFGSYAKGEADLYSDIDIVIKTTPLFIQKHEGIKGFLFLEELRKSLEKRFCKEVDICDESGLKRKEILKEAIYA
ncbi:nucleotidyltransferase family protein [Hydrogenimonas sp.]